MPTRQTQKILEYIEVMQAQMDSNVILLVAIASYLRDDPKFSEHLKGSFNGYMAARLSHPVSDTYLNELTRSLLSKLPVNLKSIVE